MRAAIYARFSSERQDERSIDDQFRLCREFVGRQGGTIVAERADYAISGASIKNRPEALRLLAEAPLGLFDTIVAEGLDRLSRDQEDVAHLFKRLNFAGVALVTVAEGVVNELHVGLKGTMNALFLKDLAAKVRRGQRGRVAAGRVPGGLGYGYRVAPELDAKGEILRGGRRIDPEEAATILRIFRAYAEGLSPRAIAAALNRDGVAAPAGPRWNASTINGNRARGSGILFNAAYAGRLVYNRVRMEKDPETGRRVSRANPVAQWVIEPAPHLRIVEDALWSAAQARKDAGRGVAARMLRQPRHLLSGLLRCAHCGGAYTVKTRDRMGCSRHLESGTCGNGRTVAIAEIETRVLDGLAAKLADPTLVAAAVQAYHETREQRRRGDQRRRNVLIKTIATLGREIERLVDRICDGNDTPATNARLRAAETEKATLERERDLLESAQRIVPLNTAAAAAYRRAVADLAATLAGSRQGEAAQLLRRLVERIEITPGAPGTRTEIRLQGRLAELLALPGNIAATGTAQVVAGDRYRFDSSARALITIAC